MSGKDPGRGGSLVVEFVPEERGKNSAYFKFEDGELRLRGWVCDLVCERIDGELEVEIVACRSERNFGIVSKYFF